MNKQVQAIRNEIDRRLKYTIERLDQSTCEKEREFDFGSRRAYIDLISFIDSLPEETDNEELNRPKLSDNLEAAAEEYTDSSEWLIGENLEHIEAAFIAGAEWMAGQGVSWEDKMTYYDGFLLYGKDERAFTMEGNFNEGEKVIVQIRKK